MDHARVARRTNLDGDDSVSSTSLGGRPGIGFSRKTDTGPLVADGTAER
jgi:hypothetical protein